MLFNRAAGRDPARTLIKSPRVPCPYHQRMPVIEPDSARVTRGPAAGVDLGYEVADDGVEQVWRFEIDCVPAIRHDRESRRWDGALISNAGVKQGQSSSPVRISVGTVRPAISFCR
jgi:hypothetical protein